MAAADSTLRENAALSHKKSGVYEEIATARMTNFFMQIIFRLSEHNCLSWQVISNRRRRRIQLDYSAGCYLVWRGCQFNAE
jgi:hypothetical protein